MHQFSIYWIRFFAQLTCPQVHPWKSLGFLHFNQIFDVIIIFLNYDIKIIFLIIDVIIIFLNYDIKNLIMMPKAGGLLAL